MNHDKIVRDLTAARKAGALDGDRCRACGRPILTETRRL